VGRGNVCLRLARSGADPVGTDIRFLDVTTGRALAEAALREPMRAIGWQPRAAGWFTRQITAGYLGVVAVGSASGHSSPGTAQIMLHVGIRHEDTEQVASQLCGLNDQGYRQRTVTAGIGYLLPDRSWRQWEITPGNAGEVARQLAAHVQSYAEPYLHRLSSDHSELLTAARNSPAYSQSIGVCRVAVLLARHQGRDEATTFLRERRG
jgi:hypothetical protein